MAKKRNRITSQMSKTIAESSPLVKKTKTFVSNSNSENIIEVKLTNLHANPFQPRIDINLQSLTELISSIEQNGLLQPIVITETDNTGEYTIIAGHRRYEAHKIMGKEKIKSIIMTDIHDKDLAILSLTENLMRENLHPIENAIAIKNIIDNKIVESQNKLAEYVGLSKGYVSKLMAILKLPTNIIQMIKKDNYKDINILVLLNKLSDEKKMLEAYKAIKSLSRSEAEKHIKNTYLSINTNNSSIISIKSSKSKISLNIEIKKLSSDQINIINKKVGALNSELEILSLNWGN